MILLTACCSQAFALSQRGHVYRAVGSFGAEGSGAGQLKQPAGVAVNEATGDIYIVDSGNNRVDRFDSSGTFISAWGWGVKNGSKELQVCTTSCQAGIAGHAKGELHGAEQIAIDNSTDKADPSAGDIYVEAITPYEEEVGGHEVEFEYGVIDKFSPSGELLAQIKGWKAKESFFEKFEEPYGIAVSPTGELWVYNEEDLVGFSDLNAGSSNNNKFLTVVEAELEGEPKPGLAVDSLGNFYLGHENPGNSGSPTEITKLNPAGELLADALDEEATSGLAVDRATNDAFLSNLTSVSVVGPDRSLIERFGAEGELQHGGGIATNSATGEVHVADAATGRIVTFVLEPPGAPKINELSVARTTASSTELGAEIDPTGADTSYFFRYSTGSVPGVGQACLSPCVETPVPPGDIGDGYSDVAVPSQKIEGLAPSTKYHYRVLASNETAGKVNAVESAEQAFKTEPELVGSTLPDGRVWEQVSPQDKSGAAIQPLTLEGGVIQASTDGEAITYVSSGAISNTEGNPEPEGNRAPDFSQIVSTRGSTSWASADIDTKNEKGEGLAPGTGPEYRFFSSDLSQAALEPFGKERVEHPPLTKEATERTPYIRQTSRACRESPAPESCFTPLVNAVNDPPIETESEGKKVLQNPFGARVRFAGASPDLSHVVLESKGALTATHVPTEQNLYEWFGGTLQLVSLLPTEAAAPNAQLGLRNGIISMVDHAVSNDGSRVIWGVYSGGSPGHLYLRDLSRGQTVQIDTQQPGVVIPPEVFPSPPFLYEHPRFQTASSDGSTVFFTDEWRLTTDSTARPEKPDLYACEIVENETSHKLECKLTDLTVDAHAGESAYVQGIVGAGEGGSSIYYVANGALSPNAGSGHCKASAAHLSKDEEGIEAVPLGATCNLYVDRFDAGSGTWGAPKLIAALSAEDEPDWLPGDPGSGVDERGNLGEITARVSPDGNRLSFMSDATGLAAYNNHDISSGRRDEEVYLYTADAEKLTCVSCNPTGARPQGVFDIEESGEGTGLLVDRPLTWTKRWLSGSLPGWTKWELNSAYYQSRYLSDQGREFFQSAEALVPQDTNGREDVYEYEPAGVGACTTESESYGEVSQGCVSLISSGTSTHESAFLDASVSGNDVFFLTDSQLAAQDRDSSFDVYDAAVCGQAGTKACLPPPAASPPVCEDIEHCHAGATAPGSSFSAPTSATPSGSGNTGQHEVLGTKETVKPKAKPLTRAQKLTRALKSCHKLKRHKKRVACEVLARKKYGPLKKSAARKSAAKATR